MTNSNSKVYIDLDSLKEVEVSRAFELEKLMTLRLELKRVSDETEKRRKEVDGELKEFLEQFGADGAIVGNTLATFVLSRSAGKWDKVRLMRILSPEELEEVYSEGKEFSYIKVEENRSRVEKVRLEMR